MLAMLTHELRTPLSIVSLINSAPRMTKPMRAQARQAILDIKRVLEHVVLATKTESQQPSGNGEPWSVVRLVEQLHASLNEPGRTAFELPRESVETMVSEDACRIIVGNLLDGRSHDCQGHAR
jgi:signal transduction histidine kinase